MLRLEQLSSQRYQMRFWLFLFPLENWACFSSNVSFVPLTCADNHFLQPKRRFWGVPDLINHISWKLLNVEHCACRILYHLPFFFFQGSVSEVLSSVRSHRKGVVGRVRLYHFKHIQHSDWCRISLCVSKITLYNQILNRISKVSIDTLTDERLPIDIEKHLKLERISLQSCKTSTTKYYTEQTVKPVPPLTMPKIVLFSWSLTILQLWSVTQTIVIPSTSATTVWSRKRGWRELWLRCLWKTGLWRFWFMSLCLSLSYLNVFFCLMQTGLWRSWCRGKSWTPGGRSATTLSSPLETQSTQILKPGTSTLLESSKTVSWRKTQRKTAETIQTLISRVTKIATTKCQKSTLRTKFLELSPYGLQMTWRMSPQMSD